MRTMTIDNPKTGRQNKVRSWDIEPRKVFAFFREDENRSARDLSFLLLGDDKAMSTMEREAGGEDSRSNFALSMFENALDWRLGLAVVNYLKGFAVRGRMPKPFQVACNRGGDVFIIGASGKLYAA